MKNIQIITSAANPLLRHTAALVHTHRRAAKEGLFIVEGLRLAEMAATSDWGIRHAFVTERSITQPRIQRCVEQLCAREIPVCQMAEKLFASLSETQTPQGILLVMERRPRAVLERLPDGNASGEMPIFLALDRLQDPGNVGTILRTADAVGISGVILLEGAADIYSGKVVRATMGSLFHVPFTDGVSSEELLHFARERGLALYSTACDERARTHFDTDFRKPILLVMGNEANGVSDELRAASEHIYIPMRGGAESLNVSAAAAALLYESMRQRRFA